MNDLISPAAGVQPDRRSGDRPAGDRRASPGKNLPVVVETPAATSPARPTADPGAAEFAAQLIGQTGQKRGLKGGPPVLNQARSVYLSTEWSGPNDRRGRAGRITRTDV